MAIESSAAWLLAVLLLTVRIAPVLAFAPPFTMLRIPARVRVLASVGFAASLVPSGLGVLPTLPRLLAMAGAELFIGMAVAFSLQAAFSTFYFVGRVVDIQAGFGLAMVIDPATRTQSPLLGSIFALGAGMVFFAANGHHDLLRLLASLAEVLPPGAPFSVPEPDALLSYFGTVFSMGLALGVVVMSALFLVDIAIGFLSRTMPQMNMLVLGFQVKTLIVLLVLAATMGLMAPAMLKVLRAALEFPAFWLSP